MSRLALGVPILPLMVALWCFLKNRQFKSVIEDFINCFGEPKLNSSPAKA